VLFLVAFAVAVLLAVPGLREVVDRLGTVDPSWIVLAVGLELVSCLGFVLAFQHVFHRAPRRFAARLAWSEMAFGAVVPAGGAGGIAVGAWVVKAKGGSLSRFAERSAVLFLLTSAVNVATLALAGLAVGLGLLSGPDPLLLGVVPGAVGVAVIAAFAAVPRLSRRLADDDERRRATWLRATARVIDATLGEIRRPGWRTFGAVAYLWADIAMLWVCFQAFGEAPPIGALTLAFLIGYVGNILPVPGGIGVLDGGLTGALILYGASPATAVAAVLVYHAVLLCVPMLLGTIAFVNLRRTIDEPLVLRPERAPA
jgi:uncharacterized membrane protein YbhN (UPF0104 family)